MKHQGSEESKTVRCGKACCAERNVLCGRPSKVKQDTVMLCDRLDCAYRDIPESLESLLAASLGTGVTWLRHFSECNFATCEGRPGVA